MTADRYVVKDVILRLALSAGAGGITALQAARAADQTKSPHLVGILNEMVTEQLLFKAWDTSRYPARFRYYAPAFRPVENADNAPYHYHYKTSEQQLNALYELAGYDVSGLAVAS